MKKKIYFALVISLLIFMTGIISVPIGQLVDYQTDILRVVRIPNIDRLLSNLYELIKPESILKNFNIDDLSNLPGDSNIIEEKLKAYLNPTLRALFSQVAQITGAKGKDQPVDHTIGVLTSVLQLPGAEFTENSERLRRLEKLSLTGNKERVEKNLEKIRQFILVEDLYKWMIISIFHDIGKAEEKRIKARRPHEELSYELIKENKLLRGLNLSKQDQDFISQVIRYHLFYGLIFTGEFSLAKVISNIFENEDVKEMLVKDPIAGTIDTELAKELLRGIGLINLFDAAGRLDNNNTGVLTNTRIEYMTSLVKKMISILEESGWDIYESSGGLHPEFISLINEHAQELAPVRMVGFFSCFDEFMDKNVSDGSLDIEGWDFYWSKIESKAKQLIREGEISNSDWRGLLRDLYKMNFRYFNYTFSSLAYAKPNLSGAKGDFQVYKRHFRRGWKTLPEYAANPNAIKFLILLNKAAQKTNTYNIVIGDEEGSRVDWPIERRYQYVFTLNEVLREATTVLKEEDGSYYFVDKNGKVIRNSPVIKAEGEQLRVYLRSG